MNIKHQEKNDPVAKARYMRHWRAKMLAIKIGVWVLLPSMIATIYFCFVATRVYQSNSKFTVQTSKNKPSFGIESLIGGISGTGSTRDALSVEQFILSRDMLALLEKKHHFLDHYKDSRVDWWSRLSQNASFEKSYKYYLKTVNVEYDSLSGVLSLSVKAYSPDKARLFADTILHQSEDMVNKLSQRIRQDQTDFAKAEVANAERKLKAAEKEIVSLQNEHAEFNPSQSAKSVLTIRGELEGELAMALAELSQAQAIMRPGAPRVVVLRQKVKAIQKQVDRENQKLTGPSKSGLNETVAKFEWVMFEKKFAQKEYQTALASYEMAKIESARQSRYLATISKPSLPDEANYPKRLKGIVSVFLVSLAIFGICSLLIASIKEHARISHRW